MSPCSHYPRHRAHSADAQRRALSGGGECSVLQRSHAQPQPNPRPEFEAWVRDALRHHWGGPKPAQPRATAPGRRRWTGGRQPDQGAAPGARLRHRTLKPGKPNPSAPEWLLYNILEMRFIQGRRIREIADRLAISESDLYRKQRGDRSGGAGTQMEQGNGPGQTPHRAEAAENSRAINGGSRRRRPPLPGHGGQDVTPGLSHVAPL